MDDTDARPRAQQSRSRETEARVLDAAVRVLGEQGAEGLTTENVSAAAGVAVGTIYRRFGNKEQLLLAAQDEFLRVFETLIETRMSQMPDATAADAAATIAHLTHALASSWAEEAAPLRALLLVGLQNPVVYADGHRASVRGGRVFAEIVLRHRERIAHDDPDGAVDFAYRTVYSTCAHRVIQGEGHESDRTLTWDEMADRLSGTVTSYLLYTS